MTSGLELPPLPAAFPFQQPFDGKVFVPVAELDFFYWPAITGEKYPPTFAVSSGTSGYATQGAYPCVKLAPATAGGTVNTATCTWPALPVSAPRGTPFAGLTITFKFNLSTNTEPPGSIPASFTIGTDINVTCTVPNNGVGYNANLQITGGNTVTLPGTLHTNQWYDVAIVMDATGNSAALTFGTGNTGTATGLSGVPTTALVPKATCTTVAGVFVSGATACLSQLKVAYS